MRLLVSLVLAVLVGAVPCTGSESQPPIPPEVEKDIRALLEATGSADLAHQVVNQMVTLMKPAMPNVPEQLWDDFVAKVDTSELLDLIVPIYAKHFEHSEIKGLLEFYSSPLGQKVTSTLPAVVHESMLAGQQWGQSLAAEVVAEIEAKGHNRE